jgi:hypothetical protein
MNPGSRFQPELSDAEWDLVLDLLDAKAAELPSEIHHTSHSAYRNQLRQRLELIEGLQQKLGALRARRGAGA